MVKRSIGHALMAFITLSSVPVLAESSNFGTITLGGDRVSTIVNGSTGGSTSLPAIVSNSDRHGNRCLGFADPTPDHILVLQQNFSRLQLRVDSGGQDTTLVVAGPNGAIRCGDDRGNNRDGAIDDGDWQAGTYRVWVGSGEPRSRYRYRLTVRN